MNDRILQGPSINHVERSDGGWAAGETTIYLFNKSFHEGGGGKKPEICPRGLWMALKRNRDMSYFGNVIPLL